VEALPQATQQMLQVAAVSGRRVDHHLLAEVAARPPERLVESLREAVAHHLLMVDADSGAYAFRHALVQEAIYDDLLPVQRPPLHAAYARALAARIEGQGGTGAVELGRLAYHWYAAHDLGQALLASVQAGQAAERRPSRWPRRRVTTNARWSCGARRPKPPRAAHWTAVSCCGAPRRRRAGSVRARGRSP
jgi:hypothetical protein